MKNKKKHRRDMSIVKDFVLKKMTLARLEKKYSISAERCRQIVISNTGKEYKKHKEKIRYDRYVKRKVLYLEKLTTLCHTMGYIPSYEQAYKNMKDNNIIHRDVYTKYRRRLVKLGYKTLCESKKQAVLDRIIKMAIKLNRVPNATELQIGAHIHYEYHFKTIKNLQKIVKEACWKEFGIHLTHVHPSKKATLDKIVKLAIQLKKLPNSTEIKKIGINYLYYFGTIKDCQKIVKKACVDKALVFLSNND